jgi:aminomethyltransferase
MILQTIPLEAKHIELGAKMMPFAGFNMPVRYSSDKQEHFAVRNKVGVFDVSHMGEFFVKGVEAVDFIQYATTNDVSKLVPGKIQYSCLPNKEGGIVDDLLVYCLAESSYLLVVNAGNIDKDWSWLFDLSKSFDVEMTNQSSDYALLAVQGPKAILTVNKLTTEDISSMVYYTFSEMTVAGVDNVIVSATGYTGSGGFELYVKKENVVELWDALFEAGKEFGIEPIGLGARDTLRLEKGFCLYGNDIDENTSPIEAGLSWITKLSTDFIGKDKIIKLKEAGVTKRLVGLKMLEKGLARHGYEIVDSNEHVIGIVTSGTISPVLNHGIAIAYINEGFNKVGMEVFVRVRKKMIKAEIVKFPFV